MPHAHKKLNSRFHLESPKEISKYFSRNYKELQYFSDFILSREINSNYNNMWLKSQEVINIWIKIKNNLLKVLNYCWLL